MVTFVLRADVLKLSVPTKSSGIMWLISKAIIVAVVVFISKCAFACLFIRVS